MSSAEIYTSSSKVLLTKKLKMFTTNRYFQFDSILRLLTVLENVSISIYDVVYIIDIRVQLHTQIRTVV